MKVENEFRIEGETWSLEDGRCIVTPDGRFNLTYGTEKGSGLAMFPNFCKLDRIAQQVAALPELLAALQAVEKRLTGCANAFYGAGTSKALRAAFADWKADIAPARAAIAKALGHE